MSNYKITRREDVNSIPRIEDVSIKERKEQEIIKESQYRAFKRHLWELYPIALPPIEYLFGNTPLRNWIGKLNKLVNRNILLIHSYPKIIGSMNRLSDGKNYFVGYDPYMPSNEMPPESSFIFRKTGNLAQHQYYTHREEIDFNEKILKASQYYNSPIMTEDNGKAEEFLLRMRDCRKQMNADFIGPRTFGMSRFFGETIQNNESEKGMLSSKFLLDESGLFASYLDKYFYHLPEKPKQEFIIVGQGRVSKTQFSEQILFASLMIPPIGVTREMTFSSEMDAKTVYSRMKTMMERKEYFEPTQIPIKPLLINDYPTPIVAKPKPWESNNLNKGGKKNKKNRKW